MSMNGREEAVTWCIVQMIGCLSQVIYSVNICVFELLINRIVDENKKVDMLQPTSLNQVNLVSSFVASIFAKRML